MRCLFSYAAEPFCEAGGHFRRGAWIIKLGHLLLLAIIIIEIDNYHHHCGEIHSTSQQSVHWVITSALQWSARPALLVFPVFGDGLAGNLRSRPALDKVCLSTTLENSCSGIKITDSISRFKKISYNCIFLLNLKSSFLKMNMLLSNSQNVYLQKCWWSKLLSLLLLWFQIWKSTSASSLCGVGELLCK